LKRAIQFDPTDADVLIGIYRASQKDPSWRKETLGLISDAVQTFREEVRDYEGQAAEAPTEGHRADIHRELASAHNQLAWLVANTQGDYDEALRSSQRSLELRPETAGYLDTLAQCYYAKGDYTKAVVHQSRAAELDPHSGQILRQLDFFKRAAEKQFR
jgi:tetratricopeptide (TPR) repeat protein